MYDLQLTYGMKSYKVWQDTRTDDLRETRTSPGDAAKNEWKVSSFRQLVERVSFLTSMNKRFTLYFRGQAKNFDPIPSIFRPTWRAFDTNEDLPINESNRHGYWAELLRLGEGVFQICKSTSLGLPRYRGLRDVREAQWAIIQHYGLWPTPLIDVTSSLRVAASFALGCQIESSNVSRSGYLFVVGMPDATGSITYSIDQHIILARLQSVCPPVAKRPHFQDGYLVGHFPMYDVGNPNATRKSSLSKRLIALFRLTDDGSFWDDDYPMIQATALIPNEDELHDRFLEAFGLSSTSPVAALAHHIADSNSRRL